MATAEELVNTEMESRRPGPEDRPAAHTAAGGASATVLHVFDHSFPINDGYAFRSGEIVRFLRRSGWRTAHVTSAKQTNVQRHLYTMLH